jgi:hypothetical protein
MLSSWKNGYYQFNSASRSIYNGYLPKSSLKRRKKARKSLCGLLCRALSGFSRQRPSLYLLVNADQ